MDERENLVWYASYGSNIMYDRFLCYIQGGTFYANNKQYNGCKDKTPPLSSKAVIIPYEMYFGNESSSWKNNDGKKTGVAFLDTLKKGATVGRMYLITEKQFDDIWEQECKLADWYDKKVFLGEYEGFPVWTFTNSKGCDKEEPSEKYLDVIRKGIGQIIPDLVKLQ